jgi:hypothetical protein
MAILNIKRDWGVYPAIVRIASSDTLATVGGAGYLTAQLLNIEALNGGKFEWVTSDFVLVYASNGWGFFNVSADFTSLDAFAFSAAVVGTPVVVGDFAVFASTSGNLEDLGYLPSNAAYPNVVMNSGTTIANHIAVYNDTHGSIGEDAATAINGGNIQAGLSGTAGYLASFPATASKGSLEVKAVANTGNTVTTISNVAMGQASVIYIPDPAAATADFVIAPAALVSGNVIQASGTAGLVADSGFPAATALRQYAQVAMTAAQWNGMYAAPFLLVAAPGANKMIIVESMQACMTFVSADYAAGGVVAAQYGNTVHGAGPLATNSEAAADFFAAASTVFNFVSEFGNTVGALPFSSCANTGIYLSNATGAFTTGDSTWIIKVYYHVVSTIA